MNDYAELEKLVDAYGRDEWHHGNTPDFTNKRDLALSHKAELMTAIGRLVAERKEWNATITAERERMDRLVEQITAERDALRKELEAMREIAANRCVIPKVIDELGPLSLWSRSEFEAEVQRRIDAAIREQEEKP